MLITNRERYLSLDGEDIASMNVSHRGISWFVCSRDSGPWVSAVFNHGHPAIPQWERVSGTHATLVDALARIVEFGDALSLP